MNAQMRRERRAGRCWVSATLLALHGVCGGCGVVFEEAFNCGGVGMNGIDIRVFEAATGAPIACGAYAVLADEAYLEIVLHPMSASPSCDNTMPLEGARDRVGTYSVKVAKDGYEDLVFTDVIVTWVVSGGACHVNTARLNANLVKRVQ